MADTAASILADIDLTPRDISALATADAVAAFLTRLGYPTDARQPLSPTAFGLSTDTADAIRSMELLAEDAEQFLRVVFVELRSVTAKARNELARNFGKRSSDHLVILTAGFDVLEFVLIDKETRQARGPGGGASVRAIPRTVSVDRKAPGLVERRILRRLTWTGKDGLDQFDKLRSVFQSAHYAEKYFTNRALFSDHYLERRLTDDGAWRENPTAAYTATMAIMRGARNRWACKDEQAVRDELFKPIWKLLGFKATINKAAKKDDPTPDYLLTGPDGEPATAAFVYRWDRWLDGTDPNDPDTPDENPGAAVVSALAAGDARWIIVTNGKLWRLYSKDAHSRSTNFYEVDLEEALAASGETDPNEAFRYWWLFFRREAFIDEPGTEPPTCWLDRIVQGSRDYAERLGDRLKDRVFLKIFPHLAQGFLHDRKKRLGMTRRPTDDELRDTYEATLTLLYRLLFLLYAEARDLLPIGETAYRTASLKAIEDRVAAQAGAAESHVPDKLAAFSDTDTTLYDHLLKLFVAMDLGDPLLNVPCYNGGLFITEPAADSDAREQRIARFLCDHKVPDRFLALAIDRLSRDVDDKTLGLVFIDYKSLEVRHLGSIYEGLLEFKLKVADEDLATKTEKKREKYVPLSEVRTRGRKKAAPTAAVRKGEVYLSNDKAERKATGSYYTPDPIVEYIVEHTVGPVLDEKLQALKGELDKATRTYRRHLTNARNNPGLVPGVAEATSREQIEQLIRARAAEETYDAHTDVVDQVFDMKVLDPAMGSGHFLVEAVDFITDRLLDFLNRYPNNPVGFMLDRTRRSILDALGEQGVTVDPAKLTDVNLLKRHVLKRCIYGVDLNPMAVELAKVSLWLDAFTLGAPLSFLDHHLRCGNSLIGATFADLKKATEGQLFGIDYEPLLRAIRHVLFINEMSDATAAEVHRSADEYALARQELSGYQIMLDLLLADYFVAGKVKSSGLLREADDLDCATRATLLGSLDEKAALLVAQVEATARRPDIRFFHWEIEFPEVFFGFADADRRRVVSRNDIAAGSAGFDAVVGNPPYDELSQHAAGRELPEKLYFKENPTYRDAQGGRLNVFRLFVVRAMEVLRTGGRHSFIVPMALLADQFTAALRNRLLTEGWLRSVAAFPQKDDPSNRVFFEAKLSTCIYLTEKLPQRDHKVAIATYPGKSLRDPSRNCEVSLTDLQLLEPHGLSIPTVAQADIDRWHHLAKSQRTTTFETVARCYLGEVMFNASNDDLISQEVIGPRVLRGGNVNRYCCTEDSKQGDIVYLNYDGFLARYANDARITHRHAPRVAFQEAAPIDNWRRLIPAYMSEGQICGHTLRYFSSDARYDLFAVLACLASAACEWRFGLTSTNNHVNAYEVNALPLPRFRRLIGVSGEVDWSRWERLLFAADGSSAWEREVLSEMTRPPGATNVWPDSIHDALAAAGKEMTRLAEERQRLTHDFADWLVQRLDIDEARFSGMTYLRGGQADLDDRDWDWFHALLNRNRRACGSDPARALDSIRKRYDVVIPALTEMRERFRHLDAAIDRIVWQLLGLTADGSVPESGCRPA